MRTAACKEVLAETIRLCTVTADPGTPLGRTGTSILLMARSYESDGTRFQGSGDPVNALASFWYAFGWLDFGISFGILGHQGGKIPCIFSGPFDEMPSDQRDKLVEKSTRYARLLSTARSSVLPAPDPSTPVFASAQTALCIAATYNEFGILHMNLGQVEMALACFSYGHGWLDAAVTAGLFSVKANREIFTV